MADVPPYPGAQCAPCCAPLTAKPLCRDARHARWECLRAAGRQPGRSLATGTGPVSLEEGTFQ